ncbi:hypothetical protein BDW59DRAFT_19417 [Aspergillus cavernicola]|uniref:TLC domain-containing protein n=1 Tax=Aspergillus cavernicola TaxID=176166 RepID=A0ABR4HH85_9EURO
MDTWHFYHGSSIQLCFSLSYLATSYYPITLPPLPLSPFSVSTHTIFTIPILTDLFYIARLCIAWLAAYLKLRFMTDRRLGFKNNYISSLCLVYVCIMSTLSSYPIWSFQCYIRMFLVCGV